MGRRKWDFFVNMLAASIITPRKLRFLIYSKLGIQTDTNNIFSRCYFETNNVKIGENTFINSQCHFENVELVEIGKDCRIAFQVVFCTSTHKIGNENQRGGETVFLPIKVGNGCWIGARAMILPGVTIGNGCIIAAGAVVTRDCEPNGLYAGVPAKRIKDLPINKDAKRAV